MNPDDVPKHLIELLHYIEDSTEEYATDSTDTRIRRIHENVSKLKQDRTWEGRYMTFEELLKRSKEEGIQQEREQLSTLARLMDENGESDQVGRLLREPDYLNEMLHKYQLES